MRSTHSALRSDVVVIGAGPIGLAAAAHLADRGTNFLVLEKGFSTGNHVREWGHVRMFSPWKDNVDAVAARLLAARGWHAPAGDAHPTGDELCDRLLEPLAALPEIADNILFGAEVVGVSRWGVDRLRSDDRAARPFQVRVRLADGIEENIRAGAVLDASGTWENPKPLGASGLPAIGEREAAERILYGIPNLRLEAGRRRYADKRVAVVGAGDSAFNALIDFAEFSAAAPGTEVSWILRGGLPSFGGGPEQLPAQAALVDSVRKLVSGGRLRIVADFPVASVDRTRHSLRLVSENAKEVAVDEIVCATGFRPDLGIVREVRLELDLASEAPKALGPLIDPNVQSCGTAPSHGYRELRHPDEGIFLVGMKSYGRAPTFLLRTGYGQVRSVVAALSAPAPSRTSCYRGDARRRRSAS